MKRAGIIICASGVVFCFLSSYDLFGAKHFPIPLTVTVMIFSIAAMFGGPALSFFPSPAVRRKKILRNAFIISISLIALGSICVWQHVLGARVEIIVGSLILIFFNGTLLFKSKYEKWKIYTRSGRDAFFLCLFDYLGMGCLILGILFKVQHWPLSGLMTIIGISVMAVGTFLWNQKFKTEVIVRKEAEDKLQESLEEIEIQHQILEEKQKEIIDSINYAKRIQQSLLPTEKYIEKSLKKRSK